MGRPPGTVLSQINFKSGLVEGLFENYANKGEGGGEGGMSWGPFPKTFLAFKMPNSAFKRQYVGI